MNTSKDNSKILIEIGKKKVEILEEISKIEQNIYDLETKYLEITQSTGNIIKGWEHIFVPKPKVHNTSTPINYKKVKFPNNERIFSQTSFTNPLLKDDTIVLNQNDSSSIDQFDTNFLKRKKKIPSLTLKKKKKIEDDSFKISDKDSLEE